MNNDNWKWYAGDNEEFYKYGSYDSKKEAIEDNKDDFDDRDLYIIEAKQEHLALSDFIDIESFINSADYNAVEQHVKHGWIEHIFDVRQYHKDDLKARIKKACDEWQSANNIVFYPEMFTNTRNEDVIPVEDAEVAEKEQ